MIRPPKPYPDFPLTAHPNGQWSKKVNKGVYYFGSWKDDHDGSAALLNWISRRDAIRAGVDKRTVTPQTCGNTIGSLKDEFLESKRIEVSAGDKSPRTLEDYQTELALFLQAVDSKTPVASFGPGNFTAYHKSLVTKRHLGRHSRKRVIAYIKCMFRWGAGTGRYPLPLFGNDFKSPDTTPESIRLSKQRAGKVDHSQRIVTGTEIDKMLSYLVNPPWKYGQRRDVLARLNMRGVILLGINCGMGPADIGRLRWSNLNFATRTLNMPRGKTGVLRVGYLWRKTCGVLKAIKRRQGSEHDGLVFRTKRGKPFYEEIKNTDGSVSSRKVISQNFYRLAERLKLVGVTHYRLRHSFATWAKRAHDQEALDRMMGHKDRTIGATYTQGWEIEFSRIKRVAKVVYKMLWPKALTAKKAA